MNNSTGPTVTADDLDGVNDEMAVILHPVIAIVCIYMIVGVLGNPLVIYYYGFSVKPSPSYYFIVLVAVFDLIICCISIPLEIVDMMFSYKFPSVIGCKIFRCVNYFSSVGTGLVLIAIAIDRYRKVCQPFKSQITMKMAKIIIFIVCFTAACISWPGFVFYDVHAVNISSVPGLIGYDCTTIREKQYKLYILIFNGVCFLIFLVSIVTLTVLYILVGKKLCHLKRFRFSTKTRRPSKNVETPPTSSSEIISHRGRVKREIKPAQKPIQLLQIHKTTDTINTSVYSQGKQHAKVSSPESTQTANIKAPLLSGKDNIIFSHLNRTCTIVENSLKNLQHPKSNDINDFTESDSDTRNPKHDSGNVRQRSLIHRKKKIRDQYIHLKKYTLLMFSVSLAFIVSFLPYLALMTWRTLVPQHEGNIMTKDQLVAYNIFLRSWIISSVVNPLIYGFFNADFSSFVFDRIKRCFFCGNKQKDETNSKQESSHTP
ncbi:unnamed protein product [Mytilus coruscus]|uniref:G-protein coupled receptors family 1 profile domain-containing protein n=1 Tax=Mytilus coruscus TaxID=42192 RepID=A0A6J8B1Z8_MYTCO|nr:unnamed protein product [Mytilus coruscus]